MSANVPYPDFYPRRATPGGWQRRFGRWAFVTLTALMAAEAQAAAPQHQRLQVRRGGVGPLAKTTPVDPKVLRPMFVGCRLSSIIHRVKGRPTERTVAIICHKKLRYTLHSETDLRTLAFVEVHAPQAVTQDHIAQGDKLGRLFALGQVDCDAGVEPAHRIIQCTLVGHSAFGYRARDGGHGPAGILPPPQDLKALPIAEIVWRASMI